MTKVESQFHVFLEDEQASQQWAAGLAEHIYAPLIITFTGDLGAGKTTIVRSLLRALGIEGAIKSPTFSLVESYSCEYFLIHHFDLYRMHNEEELEYIGFREFFSQNSICCIEWPEHAGSLLSNVDIAVHLKTKGRGRELTVNTLSAAGHKVMTSLRIL